MTNRTFRLGVIGCGFFAQNHLHAWRDLPEAELVAVCDSDASKAEAAAYAFGASHHYTDAAEMLAKETLDFVDIVTTPDSHRLLVELAAAHGRHVICQKPLAWTLADAQAMVVACQQAGVSLMVHQNFRWQTQLREVKKVLASGAIGRPFFARISFRSAHNPFTDEPWLRDAPRFVIMEVGLQLLDLARFYFGEFRSLTASTQRLNPAIGGEDVATILCNMEGDSDAVTCLVDCSFATQQEHSLFPQTLVTIEGTQGVVELAGDYRLHLIHSGRMETRTVPVPRPAWSGADWNMVQESVVAIQRHWLTCLHSGKQPETSGAEHLRVLEMALGAYAAAEKGIVYFDQRRGRN